MVTVSPEQAGGGIPAAWNDTGAEYPEACVHELFERQVERAPGAVAVVFGDRQLTYRELNDRANQVAHFLRRRGVGPETLVGVSLNRSPELVVALLGVWKAGAAYVPLDPAYPPERLAFMVGDAGLRLLLTEAACQGLFPDAAEAVCLDTDWPAIAQEPTFNPAAGAVPANLAYVMYTSGSTGRPKGAMILHGGLVNYLWWAISAYGVEAGCSVPVHSSISFDLTVTSLYPALLAGGQAELLPEDVGAQQLVAALRRGRGRGLVKITPAHLDLLRQLLGAEETAGLTRVFVIGGENLVAESLQLWRDFAPGTRLINEYGPTETVVGCCVHEVQPGDPRSGSVPIGRPIANTQLYILGADLKPVRRGETGELYIGGAGVARGYHNRPELTAERFLVDRFSGRDGARLYKTGDLARHRADGILEYLGRADDQVKVRGYRIELGEIEAVLAGHPAVQACAVLAREDVPGNRQLVGYVVTRPGEARAAADAAAFLTQRLPEYMVPAQFVLLESLPLTQNGKVDRKALPAPSAANALVSGETVAPRNETERSLAAIWCELLGLEQVGIHDDFFELGGHSLLVIKAMSRIRDVFEVELPAQALFETSTVAGLAALVLEAGGGAVEVPRIEPRREQGPCALSFAQEQIWFLDRLVPGSPAYHIVDVIALRGPFDGPALKRAVAELVRRHQVLRTSFSLTDGQLLQAVEPAFELPLPEVDLGALPAPERQEAWLRLVRQEGRRPFDLARPPLLRATVVHDSPQVHRVLLTIHHIVSDEWAMGVIQDEVTQLYGAFTRGHPSPLPELTIQYADFACWQRGSLQGEQAEAAAAYWRAELAGASPLLDLPADRPRPPMQTFRGATEFFALPRALLQRLEALGRSEQATLFMVLEAAFAAMLHRHTGQADVLVGTPITGRTQSETERLVGCFLNTVVLRSTFTDGLTFRGLLQQARQRALGAFAHSELPFERLVAALAPERDASRSPLFQAMFVLHSPDGRSQVANLSALAELETGTSKFDLTLYTSETARGLEGVMEYSTDLFEAETIRRLCRHYAVLLEAIASDLDERVARLPMLPEPDLQQLLAGWNDTAVTFPGGAPSLHRLLERQAARSPDAVAVACAGQALTYRELDQRANQLAHHLAGLGVGPDVLVGVLVERSLEMVVALLGIMKAGGAYVPLDPAFPTHRLDHMVADSRMPVLVTHQSLEQMLGATPPAVVHLDRYHEAEARHADGPPSVPGLRPDHLAYVLYTSGSTGLPKGVAISHAAIVNFILSMQREPGLTAADTLLAVTTLSFDIAGLELYLPLSVGARVVVASREEAMDPVRLMARMRESGATALQATPATWRSLIEAGWIGSPGLKALCGGEAMPPDLARALLPRCAQLWNMYGPTETTVWSTLHRITSAEGAAPIGHPIANTQTYVLDAERQLVPPGVVGELYLGGDGLARGYLNRPELTRERFVPSPFRSGALLYRTGDLARRRSDGLLECLGRTDHQVKLRGYRIELGEIEAVMAQHPAVRQVVVVAREDVPGDKRLVAYLVAEEAHSDLVAPLRAHLRTALPDYMVPAHLVRLEALPLTPNGKVDRKALPAPEAGDALPSSAYLAPRNDLEISLATAWEGVLRVPRVGITDNFFDLGGSSLSVLKLLAEMKNATGLEIGLDAVFRFPTIAELVEGLGAETTRSASALVPLQPKGAGPPVFCLCGVTIYREFARSLGTGQPVYGVYVAEEQALADQATRGEKLDVSIDRLADAYLKAIVRAAPRGPYRLAGISFGGVLAVEVASRLRQQGAEVELVMLLDTMLPRGIHRNWLKWVTMQAADLARGNPAAVLSGKLSRLRERLGGRPARAAPGAAAGGATRSVDEAFELRQQAFYQAIGTWDTGRLVSDFDVVLFRATEHAWGRHVEFDEDYGWRHFLARPLRIVQVAGDHLGIIQPPQVAELGRVAQQSLR